MSLKNRISNAYKGLKIDKELVLNPLSDGFISLEQVAKIFGGDNDYWTDFIEVPELNIIINSIARAESKVKLSIVSKVTGNEISNSDVYAKLLRTPNNFQAFTEFWQFNSINRSVFGNEYLYFNYLNSIEKYTGLFSLPPSNVKVNIDKDVPFHLRSSSILDYKLNWNNTSYPISKENLIHLNDNSKDGIVGISKIKTLQPAIKNIRAAYQKRNIALKMPLGSFSNGKKGEVGQTLPLYEKEKENLQNEFAKYGIGGNQYSHIISETPIIHNSFATNVKQMGLFEEVREDLIRIADAFGFPFELLGAIKGNCFASNDRNSELWLFENTVIPNNEERVNALNLLLDTKNKSWEVKADYSHLPLFQKNIGENLTNYSTLINALSTALADGAITVQEYQAKLKEFDNNGI